MQYETKPREPADAPWRPVNFTDMMAVLKDVYSDPYVIIKMMHRGGVAHTGPALFRLAKKEREAVS